MRKSFPALATAAILLGILSLGARAQIKSFTLAEMIGAADQAVHGEILAARAFRAERGGDVHYYTALTIQGRSLTDGRPVLVDVTFRGGFVSETEGVFNSEAPAADDVQVGKRVVAFYRWSDDLGGGVPGNVLMAAHGGLYRVVEGTRGPTVLGRGEGYAIRYNQRVQELESAVRLLQR
jgi:hypothetical protein